MTLKDFLRTMLALAIVVAGTHSTSAQNANSGEIKGTVTDPTSAVIPDVSVKIVNLLTGVTTTCSTNSDGIYEVPSVPTGEYSITFSRAGFRDTVNSHVTVRVDTIAINSQMQIGAASEQVVVTTDAPLVQTEDSGQHMDFDTKAVQDAPTVGGVWYNELTNELPGVNGGGGQDASGQGIGINGTQAYSSSFLMKDRTRRSRETPMRVTTTRRSMPLERSTSTPQTSARNTETGSPPLT